MDRSTHGLLSHLSGRVDGGRTAGILRPIGTEDEEDDAYHHQDHHQRHQGDDPGEAVVGQAVPFDSSMRLTDESESEGAYPREEGLKHAIEYVKS